MLDASTPYDSTDSVVLQPSNIAVSGLLDGDVLTITQTTNSRYTTAGSAATIEDVGTGKTVEVNGMIVTAFNPTTQKTIHGYAFSSPTLTGPGVITKAPITLSMSKTYDGNAIFPNTIVPTVTGTFNGDQVALSGGTATVSSANAATYNSFASNSFSITSDRYTLDGATYNITIDKAALSLAVNAVYSGSTALVPTSYTLSGLVNNETLVPTGVTAQSANVSRNGSNFVTALTANTGTADLNNYSITLLSSPVTLSPKVVGLTGTLTASKTYDGQVSASIQTVGVTPSTVFNNDDVSVASISGTFDSPNVSTTRILTVTAATLTGASASNYEVSAAVGQTGVGTISQLASATWVGPAGGNWNDGANWGVTGQLSQVGVLPNESNVALAIIGSGDTVVANAATNYTGRIQLAGTLKLANDSYLGAVPSSTTADLITIDGGTLQATSDVVLNAQRGITIGSGGATIAVDAAQQLSYAGVLQGTAGLTKTGSGRLVLSGTNSYTTTNISAGTLQLGQGGNTGTLGTGDVTVDGRLAFDWLSDTTVTHAISGTGGLVQAGTNNISFTGAQTFTGTTDTGPLGSRLTFIHNTPPSTARFTGLGAVAIQPVANASFASAFNTNNHVFDNSLSGLTVGHVANTSDITLGAALSMAGPVRLYGGAVTLNANLSTTNSSTGDVLIQANSLSGASNLSLANTRSLTIQNSQTSTLTGVIEGSGVSLVKQGAGRLQLMGANTFTAGASMEAGSVGVYNNSALGTGTVTWADATAMTLGRGVTALGNDMVLLGTTTVNLDATLEYLVVGGGGGGGSGTANEHGGGGGGAGGLLSGSSTSMQGGSYAVTVGNGGTAGNGSSVATVAQGLGGNGGSSVLGSLTANGGGGGAVYWAGGAAKSGASGGGGAVSATASIRTGAAGIQGNAGGNAVTTNFGRSAGGGGGAGGVGGTYVGDTGGAGGSGVANDISGTDVMYAAGGGGGGSPGGAASVGAGAGGSFGVGGTSTAGVAAAANTGSGGGGGIGNSNGAYLPGGAGGSGLVVVRYLGGSAGSGGVQSAGTDLALGYNLHTFSTVGSSTLTLNAIAPNFSGRLSGAGGLTLNATGGSLTLSGDNSYTGATSITGGTVITSHVNALGNNSAVGLSNTAGALLQLNQSLSVGSLAGGGSTGGNLVLSAGTVLRSGADNSATTFAGGVSGGGGLTKQGTGVWTLTSNGTYTGVTTVSAGRLLLSNDAPSSASASFGGVGSLQIEPVGTSFSSTFLTSNWALSNTLGGLTIGKGSSTSNVTIDSATTIAGPIEITGGVLSVNAPLTATNNVLKLKGSSISDGASGYLVADQLAILGGAVTLDHASNQVNTLAASGVSSFTYVNAGAMTIGTVNPTGISATGDVRIETLSGDLTLAANVTTSSSTATAVLLNAGKNASAGTSTGGNLLVTGTPTVSVGTGGVVRLMTGSVDDSLGLSQMVGVGSGRFRYNSDETDTRFTWALNTDVVNAIYREQPTATAEIISFTTTYGFDHTRTLTNLMLDGVSPLSTQRVAVNGDTQVSGLGVVIESASYSTAGKLKHKATPYTLTDGLSKLGYAMNQSGGSQLTVDTKSIDLANFSINNKVYDGNLAATFRATDGTNIGFSGLVGNDQVTYSAGTGRFDTRHVGTGKVVTITGVVLAGADLNNYSVRLSSGDGTANLTQLSSATWIGTGAGQWSDAANWAVSSALGQTGVIPDGANVGLAVLPSGFTGTLVSDQAHGHRGLIEIQGGTLSVAADAYLGATSQAAVADRIKLDGGRLQLSDSFTMNAYRGITLAAGGGTLVVDAGKQLDYAGVIAGAGDLSKSGSGSLVLTGTSTFAGDVHLLQGDLSVGDGSNNTASLANNAINLANGTLLTFNFNANTTVANAIAGTGQLQKVGAVVLRLTGLNSYSGSTATGTAGGVVYSHDQAPSTSGFTGAGTVSIEPATFNFSSAFTSNHSFANTLTGLTLGKTGNLTPVTLNTAIGIAGPVTVTAPTITVNQAIDIGSSLRFNGNAVLNGANITTAGSQYFNGAVSLATDTHLISSGDITLVGKVNNQTAGTPEALTINAGSGAVLFSESLGDTGLLGALAINSTGATTFTKAVDAASLATNAGGTVVIKGGRITTTGAQTYGENMLLDNAAHATVLNTTNAAVTISGTVNNQTAGTPEALTINAGSGAVLFSETLGDTGLLGALTINSTGATTFTKAVDATSLTTNAGGTVVIKGGRITTTGAQSYGENMLLDNAAHATVLNTTNAAVTFSGTVNNQTAGTPEALTVNTGSGAVLFSETLGDTGLLGAVTVNSTGATAFTKAVDATSLTTNAGGTVVIMGGRITTTGAQTYGENLILDNAAHATVLNTTNAAVTFSGTVNNQTAGTPESLTINAGSGAVLFSETLGDTGLLGAVTVNSTGATTFTKAVDATSLATNAGGTVVIMGGRITTTGAQTYGENLILDNTAHATVLNTTNAAVTFSGTVNNQTAGTPEALTVNTGSGAVLFSETLGNLDALGAVTVNSAGATTFTKAVDATSLTTNAGGTVVIKGGRITTTGAQTYGENLILDNAAHATVLNTTNAAVTFSGTVNNQTVGTAESLTVNAGSGAVLFSETLGNLDALGSVVVNSTGATIFTKAVDASSVTTNAGGTVVIMGGRITTTGGQTYGENLILDNTAHATVLNTTNAAVTFSGTVNNQTAGTPEALTINAGSGAVLFSETLGNLDALGAVAVNSTGATTFTKAVDATSLTTNAGGTVVIMGGRITTTGAQSYGDDLVITAATTLDASALTFDDSLMGDNLAAHNLTTLARSGNASFNAAVGDASAPLNELLVTAANDTVFNALVTVAHLQTGSTGTTKFNTAKVLSTGPSSMVFGNDVVVSPASFQFDSTNDGLLSTGANITFNKTLSGATVGVSDVLIQAGSAGVVRLLGAVGQDGSGNSSALKSLVVSAGGGIVIGGGHVETTGTQTYDNPIVLANSNHATVLNTTNAAVTFSGTVNNQTAGTPEALTVNAGSGAVLFSETLGNLDALGAVNVNSAGATTFTKAVDATSLTTNAGGTVVIMGGRITTTGTQSYGENLILDNTAHATILNTTNAAVTFSGTVNNQTAGTPEALTINAGSGAVLFSETLGDTGLLGALAINSTGATTFTKAVDASSVTTNAGGTVVIMGGRITTTGAQSYGENMLLDNTLHATVLNTTNAAVSFSGTVNNQTAGTPEALTVNTGSGAVLFSETLGNLDALGAVAVNSTGATTFTKAVDAASVTTNAGGTVVIMGGRITTTGAQSYGDDLVITAATTLDASALTFDDSLMGDNLAAHNLTILARSGNASFNAAVGDASAPLNEFLVTAANDTVFNALVTVAHLQTGSTGTTKFNTAKVLSTGPSSMVFGNDVVVSPASFQFDSTNDGLLSTGANITFNKTLSGATVGVSDVLIQAGSAGVVRLLGAVGQDGSGNSSALKSLVVSAGGGIVIGGGHVETTGTQTYDNPIVLASSVVFKADTLSWGRVTSTIPNVGLTLSTNGHQVLTDISITGHLDVTTGMGGQVGGVSQALNTALNIGGVSSFTAHTTTGQTAALDNTGNHFAQALSFLTSNGGSWTLVDVKSESALAMGSTTVDGPIQLETTAGDISQTGPMTVSGIANFKALAGHILLNNASNVFDSRVSVDTPQSFKISATGPLSMDQVKVGQDAEIMSSGVLDLGKGSYTGKLKVNSGGFDIKQSGNITFGSDVNLDAGTAKIELMSPLNMWKGSLVFKGGVIIINHPSLMNAVNAGTLIVRANNTIGVSATGSTSGSGSSSLQFAEPAAKTGPAVSVSVDKPASANQTGMITVAVSAETAAPGRSFSFEIDPKMVGNQPNSTALKVSQLDGKPLPDWLRYEPESKSFIAKEVPAGAFPLQLKVASGGQEIVMVIQEQAVRDQR